MRSPLAPLLALTLPLLALAQSPPDMALPREPSATSIWYWVALLVLAAAVFAWVVVRLNQKRRGPPGPPRSARSY
ncbi:hypothetical protein NVS55_14265 [Myxococcus stipitatus]|uniref:hypothetical protein n=1 Tax=Myxococcus stipitatus TaxID=83455 RepID=UPI0031455D1A